MINRVHTAWFDFLTEKIGQVCQTKQDEILRTVHDILNPDSPTGECHCVGIFCDLDKVSDLGS